MIRLDAATVLLQWATGGLAFLWVTQRRREVGLGYAWLLRGIYLTIAAGALAVGVLFDAVPARDACSAAVVAIVGASLVVSIARRKLGLAATPAWIDAVPAAIGAVGLVVAVFDAGGPIGLDLVRTLVGAAFLGAVSDAMLLGHWYLVQPGLGRAPLVEMVRALALVWPFEVAALLWPTGMVSVFTGAVDDGYQGVLGWFWLACAVTTIVLCGVTVAALREKSYSAVMAATGLLYLAILTAFGTDLVARAVLAGYEQYDVKLIIQIPCLDEADQLPATLAELPRQLDGFDAVEWLIIDDGSTDRTVEVAREHGVDHIVRLTNHKGLAAAFQAGLDAALKLGADVIVNTDADRQYQASDIPKLVKPILAGDADMVVGDRGVMTVGGFSWSKKRLQWLGSWVVRRASETSVPDTTSGFRAYNREAALQLTVVSKFSYTLETLIQAGKMLVAVDHVAIGTNDVARKSRLSPSSLSFIRRQAPTIMRIYATYEPLRVFTVLATVLLVAGLAAWTPFLWDWVQGNGTGHLQSIVLGGVLVIAAVQMFALGIVADLLSHQRVVAQRTLERVRRLELHLGVPPSHYESAQPPARRRLRSATRE